MPPPSMNYDDLVDQFIVNDAPTNENKSLDKFDSELIKLHMKNLIQSRQQARQVIQLDRMKLRNKQFNSWTRRRERDGVAGYSFGNSEKRRRILSNDSGDSGDSGGSGDSGDSESKEGKAQAKEGETTEKLAEMIPCRLELDYEGYRISDVFLLPSSPVPSQTVLETIAGQLCQDFDLPGDLFQPAIGKCLKDQVEEWHVYQGALEGMRVPYEEIGAVPMRLDVIVGLHRIEDRLELSLDPCESNTETIMKFVEGLRSPDDRVLPEREYAAFRPLILHNILEQLMLWRKAIVFGGYHRDPRSNNLKFHDGDVAVLLNDAKSGSSGVRRHFADTNSFTPILSVLTVEELDKIEAGRERESRRRRRTVVTTTTPAGSKRATIGNNLTGTVRSPPRTLPTPSSYRGSLHRIQQAAGSDDESTGPRKRGRKART